MTPPRSGLPEVPVWTCVCGQVNALRLHCRNCKHWKPELPAAVHYTDADIDHFRSVGRQIFGYERPTIEISADSVSIKAGLK